MSAADIQAGERTNRIPQYFAAIGAVYDPVAIQWKNSRKEVRCFLLSAVGMTGLWADREWESLPADKRGEIRRKAGELYDWLGRWVGK